MISPPSFPKSHRGEGRDAFALWPPGRCWSPAAFWENPKLSRLIQGGEGGDLGTIRQDHANGGAGEGRGQVFKLQFHKFKPQHPTMQDQALPKHPCSWWLFLCPSPSFSLSPSLAHRLSPELHPDLTQQKNGPLERERRRKKHPSPSRSLSPAVPHGSSPAPSCPPVAWSHRRAVGARTPVTMPLRPSLGLRIPASQRGYPAPANPLLPTAALMPPATVSKDQPLK